MTTKYNVGDKVLIEVEVKEIKINHKGVVYKVADCNWDECKDVYEDKIAGNSNKEV